jgi:hypothetical protein
MKKANPFEMDLPLLKNDIANILDLKLLPYRYYAVKEKFINNRVSLTKEEPMSFFDELAQKAIRDGNTSADFKRMVQKHTNWTWVLAILTCVVWYLSQGVWVFIFAALALFSATRSISANRIKNKMEKLEKDRSFGSNSVLEKSSPDPEPKDGAQ